MNTRKKYKFGRIIVSGRVRREIRMSLLNKYCIPIERPTWRIISVLHLV